MEKLKMSVDKYLPMVRKMIKSVVIAREISKSHSWLNNKMNHREINGKPLEFVGKDIDLLNNGMHAIGVKLLQMRILYSNDREFVIEQVKSISEIICMPYIYNTIIGKNRQWYSNRMKNATPGKKKTSFSADDIFHLNMAVIDIANKLLAIEITI